MTRETRFLSAGTPHIDEIVETLFSKRERGVLKEVGKYNVFLPGIILYFEDSSGKVRKGLIENGRFNPELLAKLKNGERYEDIAGKYGMPIVGERVEIEHLPKWYRHRINGMLNVKRIQGTSIGVEGSVEDAPRELYLDRMFSRVAEKFRTTFF